METESRALQLVNWVVEKGVGGVGPLTSAASLAQEYLDDGSYADNDERAWSLIRWEASKNATTGFLTALGGIVTLPVTIPAGFGASWLVQARMAAAVAQIHGHDLQSDRVRTLVLMSILGDSQLKNPIKAAGIELTRAVLQNGIDAIPEMALVQINKAVGVRLLTKAGAEGVINLAKFVPVLGGIVGGGIDGLACLAVGRVAHSLFSPTAVEKDTHPSAGSQDPQSS